MPREESKSVAARLDSPDELASWGFSKGSNPSMCHCCGIHNSQIGGMMIQCGKCKCTYYCSMKCFNMDLSVHATFCNTGQLDRAPELMRPFIDAKKEKVETQVEETDKGKGKRDSPTKKKKKSKKKADTTTSKEGTEKKKSSGSKCGTTTKAVKKDSLALLDEADKTEGTSESASEEVAFEIELTIELPAQVPDTLPDTEELEVQVVEEEVPDADGDPTADANLIADPIYDTEADEEELEVQVTLSLRVEKQLCYDCESLYLNQVLHGKDYEIIDCLLTSNDTVGLEVDNTSATTDDEGPREVDESGSSCISNSIGMCSRCGCSMGIDDEEELLSKRGSVLTLGSKSTTLHHRQRLIGGSDDGCILEKEPFAMESIDLKPAPPLPKREYREPRPFQEWAFLTPTSVSLEDSASPTRDHQSISPYLEKLLSLRPQTLRASHDNGVPNNEANADILIGGRLAIGSGTEKSADRRTRRQSLPALLDVESSAAAEVLVLKPVPESLHRPIASRKPDWLVNSPIRTRGGLEKLLEKEPSSSSASSLTTTTPTPVGTGTGGRRYGSRPSCPSRRCSEMHFLEVEGRHSSRHGRLPTHNHHPRSHYTSSSTKNTTTSRPLSPEILRVTGSKRPPWALVKNTLRATDLGRKIKQQCRDESVYSE